MGLYRCPVENRGRLSHFKLLYRRFYAIINDQGSGEDRQQRKEKRIFFFKIFFKDCDYDVTIIS